MYKNILQNIDHIAFWPVMSFVIFFLFFVCLLWWVVSADKKFIDKMKGLPIEEPSKSASGEIQKEKL